MPLKYLRRKPLARYRTKRKIAHFRGHATSKRKFVTSQGPLYFAAAFSPAFGAYPDFEMGARPLTSAPHLMNYWRAPQTLC